MTPRKMLSLVSVVLASLVMTMSCEENTVVNKPVNSINSSNQIKSSNQNGGRIINYTFNGMEGDPITLDVASKWTLNYAAKYPLASVKSHFFGSTTLKKILAVDGTMGIRIYYALDDVGQKQLLLIGADTNGNDLLPKSGALGVTSSMSLLDAVTTDSFNGTEGEWLTEEVSMQWISSYGGQYPQSLIAHFFGFDIINQILNQSGCIGIRMYYALNDLGVQQILLVGVNDRGENMLALSLTGGRTTDGGGTVGDMSYPCPTYCSS